MWKALGCLSDNEVVELAWKGGESVCRYGVVDLPHTAIHHNVATNQACVHALEPLPQVMLFSLAAVLRCHWQPVVHEASSNCPVIASRRADVVTLAVHSLRPISGCRTAAASREALTPERKWAYRLHPVRGEDGAYDKVLLGVLLDAPVL